MAQQSQVELKAIFNLFDQDGNQEIDIKQINQMIKQIDEPQQQQILQSLNKKQQQEQKLNEEKKKNSDQNQIQENQQNANNQENQTGGLDQDQNDEITSDLANLIMEEAHVELKSFPNKKQSINFNDFAQLFNECIQNKELQDELLLNCYKAFDNNSEGFINSHKIKNIFNIFKDQTSLEEIQNVLKFIGCVEDKMSFDEFKDFYKKNL